ncbi:hypothetical protein D3C73_456610 [compost metagenome]
MRIIVGGLLQESNTFSAASSTVADFKRHYYVVGDEMNQPLRVDNELTGFYQAAREHKVTLVPTLYTNAVSSGPISRKSLNELILELLERMKQALPCDGVLFALHGAWVAEDNDDADGEILNAIREIVGKDVPIVITLDSHANVTRRMIENVNGLVGYRTFPHVDFVETGYKAAHLLFAIVKGEIHPTISLTKIPMILPAENQFTDRGPMAELWLEALKGEEGSSTQVTSLFAVQPWLDVKEMGFSVVVVGENSKHIQAESSRLGELAWLKRKAFDVTLYSVPEIVSKMGDEQKNIPIIISDSADSPGAGSPGDSNAVLRQLLEHKVNEKFKCLICMVDAHAARYANEAGPGALVQLKVGYSISTELGKPLEIEGKVTSISNGKFTFGGGHVANLEANMGRSAVVAIGRIRLLLMENPTFTGDPAMYRSMGLEPAEANLVLVKSAAQFRAEYEQLSDQIFILDTPGASTANLKNLPFRNLQRPIYPFDDNFFGITGE